MVGRFLGSTSMILISLIGAIFAVSVSPLSNQWTVFGQVGNTTASTQAGNTTASTQAGNTTGTVPLGSLERTNLDIPSLDFTLPDGSSTSADFRSIYFDSGGKTMYTYYSDYGLPEDKPTLKAGDKFTVDAYLTHQNTPTPGSIDITISKIASGAETGNFTQMKLDNPINVTSSGNIYLVPNTAPGNYILDTFVKYPFGGIVMVYTTEIQVGS
jgi:hypothetical protein